jgi:hypothetical protein
MVASLLLVSILVNLALVYGTYRMYKERNTSESLWGHALDIIEEEYAEYIASLKDDATEHIVEAYRLGILESAQLYKHVMGTREDKVVIALRVLYNEAMDIATAPQQMALPEERFVVEDSPVEDRFTVESSIDEAYWEHITHEPSYS